MYLYPADVSSSVLHWGTYISTVFITKSQSLMEETLYLQAQRHSLFPSFLKKFSGLKSTTIRVV